MIDKLRELAQARIFNDANKSLDDVAAFLYVVLDEQVRLRMIDTLERFTEKLRGTEVPPTD